MLGTDDTVPFREAIRFDGHGAVGNIIQDHVGGIFQIVEINLQEQTIREALFSIDLNRDCEILVALVNGRESGMVLKSIDLNIPRVGETLSIIAFINSKGLHYKAVVHTIKSFKSYFSEIDDMDPAKSTLKPEQKVFPVAIWYEVHKIPQKVDNNSK
jgi:hypothetical protein